MAFTELQHRLVPATGRLEKSALRFHFLLRRIEAECEPVAGFAMDFGGIQKDDVIVASRAACALPGDRMLDAREFLTGRVQIELRVIARLHRLLENLLRARLLAGAQLQDRFEAEGERLHAWSNVASCCMLAARGADSSTC